MRCRRHISVYKRLPISLIMRALDWQGTAEALRKKILTRTLTPKEHKAMLEISDLEALYPRVPVELVARLKALTKGRSSRVAELLDESRTAFCMELNRGIMTRPRFKYILSKIDYLNERDQIRIKELKCV